MPQSARKRDALQVPAVTSPRPSHLTLVDVDAVPVPRPAVRRSALTTISASYAIATLGIWALENFVGERTLFTTMLAYNVQAVFLFPSLLLLLAACVKKNRRAASYSVASALVVALLLMKPTVTFAAASVPGKTLRVMQYNVDKWDKGAPAIAAAIRSVDPDVVCLDEADNYFYTPQGATQLPTLMPEYHWIHQGENMIGSKTPITAARDYSITPTDKWRTVAAADIQTPTGPVTILSTHLLAVEWTKPRTWRHVSIERLREVDSLAVLTASQPHPWILAGDLNLQPQGLAYSRLSKIGVDTFERVGEGFGYTAHASLPCARVDHILIDRRLAAHRAWVPSDVRASDHLPLVSEITIPQPE
jgi:vancomycin resistance protein VanJ